MFGIPPQFNYQNDIHIGLKMYDEDFGTQDDFIGEC